MNHLGSPTNEEIRERITTQSIEAERSGLALLAIEEHTDPGGFIGYGGLTVGAGSHEEPELAFELLRSSQGRGIATEAAYAIVDAAHSTGRTRLWATVRKWNLASFAVLENVGFSDSGRRTEDPLHGDTFWMVRDLR
ncbi:GNAT family N-acetyltransferase [Vibrio cholerae]|nr:GNAT family N-acetyltransferase [Vibrio cholerae]